VQAVLDNEQVFGKGLDLAVVFGLAAAIVSLRGRRQDLCQKGGVDEVVILIVGESPVATAGDDIGMKPKCRLTNVLIH